MDQVEMKNKSVMPSVPTEAEVRGECGDNPGADEPRGKGRTARPDWGRVICARTETRRSHPERWGRLGTLAQ